MYVFDESIIEGIKGERQFLHCYKGKVEKLDGRANDFRIISDGRLIELKTDFYSAFKTPNFFMERFSRKGVDGGAWQALKNKNQFYVYQFYYDRLFFWFRTKQLVTRLEEIADQFPLVKIPNHGYNTYGYKIPRKLLTPIYLKRKFSKL